jgi:hypothetical protein
VVIAVAADLNSALTTAQAEINVDSLDRATSPNRPGLVLPQEAATTTLAKAVIMETVAKACIALVLEVVVAVVAIAQSAKSVTSRATRPLADSKRTISASTMMVGTWTVKLLQQPLTRSC